MKKAGVQTRLSKVPMIGKFNLSALLFRGKAFQCMENLIQVFHGENGIHSERYSAHIMRCVFCDEKQNKILCFYSAKRESVFLYFNVQV